MAFLNTAGQVGTVVHAGTCGCDAAKSIVCFAHSGAVLSAPEHQRTDAELIDAIERIRARNNTHWMNLVRLAFELSPERAKAILGEIERLDGEVRRLTQELSR